MSLDAHFAIRNTIDGICRNNIQRPHPMAGRVEGFPQAIVGGLAKPLDEAARAARRALGTKQPAESRCINTLMSWYMHRLEVDI